MSQRKETLWQVDFGLGAVRPEAVERDDTVLIEQSVREAENTIGLSTGQIEQRPGSVYVSAGEATYGFEVDLGVGLTFDLQITESGLILYAADGSVEYSNTSRAWAGLAGVWGSPSFSDMRFWAVSDPDALSVVIGGRHIPMQQLRLAADGSWSIADFEYDRPTSQPGGIPYWSYFPGVTIQPSARTGSINVTASSPIFSAAMVGASIRYVEREIVLTGFTSSTVMVGQVTDRLPPTYNFTVASTANYSVGEAVEHGTLGGLGIITAIVSGTVVTVVSTARYDGFAASGQLVGPRASSAISAQTTISPAAIALWDMQIDNGAFGYPGWAARYKGRLYLCDFPGAPQAYAASIVGSMTDFTMGPDDADGFVETLAADRGGALKYIVAAQDLIFLTTKGVYVQQTRDGSVITPSTIGPVAVSSTGCALVPPVALDEGCVFADAVGGQVHAVILGGDVYRAWKVVPMGKFHAHLTGSPVFLGATVSGSETPEQYVFAVRSDGTASVCQWDRDENRISWRPWRTEGTYLSIYQCFGKMLSVVDRVVAGSSVRFRERFEYAAMLDCMSAVQVTVGDGSGLVGTDRGPWVTQWPEHLAGHSATAYLDGWDFGECAIDGSGRPLDSDGNAIVYPLYDGDVQIGMPFTLRVLPWARRSVRTQRGTRLVKRLVQMFITVQASGAFSVGGNKIGAYRTGENLDMPPPLRDEQVKVTFYGRAHYETRAIVKDRPGPFRLLKVGYRVVI